MALLTRRFFTFAAPAIVAAPSLMHVSGLVNTLDDWDFADALIDWDFARNHLQVVQRIDADARGIRYSDYVFMMKGERPWR